jgi:hypothetical protein
MDCATRARYNAVVNERARQLLREALTLPANDRADVASELLASLDESKDDPEAVQAAWAREIEERALRALSGESGEPWDRLRGRLRSGLQPE